MLGTCCGACFGINAGFGINPARDMGPRMFLSCVGYGTKPWTVHDFWGIMCWLAQLVGGLVGGLMYDFNVTMHMDDDDDDKEKKRRRQSIERQSRNASSTRDQTSNKRNTESMTTNANGKAKKRRTRTCSKKR